MVFTPPGAVIKAWGKKLPFFWAFEDVCVYSTCFVFTYSKLVRITKLMQHLIKSNQTEDSDRVCKNTVNTSHRLHPFVVSVFSVLSGIQTTWSCGWRSFWVPMRDAWMWTLKSSLQGDFLLCTLENTYQTHCVYAVLQCKTSHLWVFISLYHYRYQSPQSMQKLQLHLQIHHISLPQSVMKAGMSNCPWVCVLPTVWTHAQMFLCTVQPIITGKRLNVFQGDGVLTYHRSK